MKMPKNEGGDFTPPPAGTHLAICYRVIDLGTQRVEYQGDVKLQRKVNISWELPEEAMEDGRLFTVHKRYTLSSHEKATLRIDLEAWRGKAFTEAELDPENPEGFDIRNVLGKGCILTVVHKETNGKVYANVSGVSKMMKGHTVGQPANPMAYLSLEPDEFDREAFDGLSEHLQETIRKSPEYQRIMGGNTPMRNGTAQYDERNPPPPDDDLVF